MKHKLMIGVGLLLAASAAVVTLAQTAEEGYQLSLADCLRMALENNLDLVSARKDPEISAENVVIEQAGFDFGLESDPFHSEAKQEITNAFSLNESKQDQGNLAVAQDLKFGADYRLDLEFRRSEVSGPLVITPEGEASAGRIDYEADLAFSFNVPLIGNPLGKTAGKAAVTERLVLAQGNLDISNEQLRVEAHRVIEDVENAYWNVLAGREALRIAELALTRAEDLLELNRKKVEVGTLAPIEITQAEAGVASQEEGVIVAETDLQNAEDELRRLLAVPHDDALWDRRILPTDRPDFVERTIDLDDAIEVALRNRPEVASARQTLINDELSERVARKRLRPGLNLNGRVTPTGNNFETVFDDMGDIVGQEFKGTFDEALSEIPDFDNYSWSVGVNFRYPIGNRAAKANYSIASLTREKSKIAVRNQEQTVRVDVRRSVRAVDSGVKRVAAARENVRLQTEKLEAEQKKFENGMSTSFEVLTFQNDLADAELALIRAALEYTRALTGLERSKGTLLQARGLNLGP